MRDQLAERLLAEVMKWKPEDVTRERPVIEALATLKYDEYQQFSPGMRFIESLAMWLNQFRTDIERRTMYEFVRSRLVFLCNSEITHLVSMAFPHVIRPQLIKQTAPECGCEEWQPVRITNSDEYEANLRRSLFLGLSDGARTDIFRRSNPTISNEQVWQTYDLSESKAEKLLRELQNDTKSPQRFRNLILLDDFTASGISYFRRDGDSFDGKIFRVFRDTLSKGKVLNSLVDHSAVTVYVVLYVATGRSLERLRDMITQWETASNQSLRYELLPVQLIPDSVRVDAHPDDDLFTVLSTYFDPGIVTEAYLKGTHSKPELGFDECALPLILPHNTPNNTVPLLWFEETRNVRGLFPRVSRH